MDVRFDRATPTLGRPVAHTANTFSAEFCVIRIRCIVLPHSFIIVTNIQGVSVMMMMMMMMMMIMMMMMMMMIMIMIMMIMIMMMMTMTE